MIKSKYSYQFYTIYLEKPKYLKIIDNKENNSLSINITDYKRTSFYEFNNTIDLLNLQKAINEKVEKILNKIKETTIPFTPEIITASFTRLRD